MESLENKIPTIQPFGRVRFTVYTQKARHFSKSKTICVTFLATKIHTLYATRFFMKIKKVLFINKKHDTLRYVTFLYKKSPTLGKSKTIRVTFLIL